MLTGEDEAEAETGGTSEEVRDANIARVNMAGYLEVKQLKEVSGGLDGEMEIEEVRKAEKDEGRYLRIAEYMTERVYIDSGQNDKWIKIERDLRFFQDITRMCV